MDAGKRPSGTDIHHVALGIPVLDMTQGVALRVCRQIARAVRPGVRHPEEVEFELDEIPVALPQLPVEDDFAVDTLEFKVVIVVTQLHAFAPAPLTEAVQGIDELPVTFGT